MSATIEQPARPLISVKGNILYHNNNPVKAVLTKDKICIGCTDITVSAAKFIIENWERNFGQQPETITL